MRLAARSALVVTLLGAPIGLLLAVLASRVVANQLFGVTATDPVLYGLATATLVAVMLAASGIPAWLVSRVNPVNVMRAGGDTHDEAYGCLRWFVLSVVAVALAYLAVLAVVTEPLSGDFVQVVLLATLIGGAVMAAIRVALGRSGRQPVVS